MFNVFRARGRDRHQPSLLDDSLFIPRDRIGSMFNDDWYGDFDSPRDHRHRRRERSRPRNSITSIPHCRTSIPYGGEYPTDFGLYGRQRRRARDLFKDGCDSRQRRCHRNSISSIPDRGDLICSMDSCNGSVFDLHRDSRRRERSYGPRRASGYNAVDDVRGGFPDPFFSPAGSDYDPFTPRTSAPSNHHHSRERRGHRGHNHVVSSRQASMNSLATERADMESQTIITTWGPYTTEEAVKASPFYTKIDIPSNTFSRDLSGSDATAVTLHAVHPVPRQYLRRLVHDPGCWDMLRFAGEYVDERLFGIKKMDEFTRNMMETLKRINELLKHAGEERVGGSVERQVQSVHGKEDEVEGSGRGRG